MIQGALLPELGRDRMGRYPPLGLLYLAACVTRAHPNVTVRIVDAITDGLSHEAVETAIRDFAPNLVGISVYTFTLVDGIRAAESARRAAPGAFVLMGGFHPTIYPEETLLVSSAIDASIRGEAEESFPELVGRLMKGGDLEGVPGLSFRRPDGSLHVADCIPVVEDLDSLPLPDRTLVDFRRHECILGTDRLSTNILSSRGCPFSCKYCYVNIRRYRLRSLDSLVNEIRRCMELGIGEFFFMDDLFNISKKRVRDFSQRILDEGLDIRWVFRGRVDQVDLEVLRLARKAGCIRIHYGVESGVPEVLKRVGKGTDLAMIRAALSATRRAGIEVASNIMIGLPDETPERTGETIRFVLSLPTDYLQAAVFTPYPATPLYVEGLENGMFERDFWRDFALNPDPAFSPRVWPQFYSRDELFARLRSLYRRFYFRPRIVAANLKHLTSPKAVKKMFKNFVTLLRVALGGKKK